MDDALFDAEPIEIPANNKQVKAPLAARMRPSNLDEVVGQSQITKKDSPLRALLNPKDENKLAATSLILWGPPGSGKTTLLMWFQIRQEDHLLNYLLHLVE